MRLIDADALIKRFEVLRDEHETHSISYNALYEVLVEQPTAYDVEKVVEQLEGQKREPDSLISLGHNTATRCAIEIVKGGGIDG